MLVSLGSLAALSGCGFRPLYAPEREGGTPGDPRLAAIRINPIYERRGQVLQQELERRLHVHGTTEARYTLTTYIQLGTELQGFRRDGSPSRIRFNYTAPYTLSTMAVPPAIVATGTAYAFDAYNIPDSQFFAGIQSANAADRRLIELIARDITERLTVALRAAPGA